MQGVYWVLFFHSFRAMTSPISNFSHLLGVSSVRLASSLKNFSRSFTFFHQANALPRVLHSRTSYPWGFGRGDPDVFDRLAAKAWALSSVIYNKWRKMYMVQKAKRTFFLLPIIRVFLDNRFWAKLKMTNCSCFCTPSLCLAPRCRKSSRASYRAQRPFSKHFEF